MIIKRIVLTTALVASAVVGMQADGLVQKIQKRDGKFYFVNKERIHLIDTTYVTIQKKDITQVIESKYVELGNSKSRFIDIKVPTGICIEDFVKELERLGNYSSVELHGYGKFDLTPNDTYYSSYMWYASDINLPSAWDITTGSPSVKIAVIDSGTDIGHSDLGLGNDGYSNVDTSLGWDYTHNVPYTTPVFSHGTFMSGIIGAKTNNSFGFAGVCGGNHSNGATIIPYCIANNDNFSENYIDDAILDAISKGAKVINISLHTLETSDINYAIEQAYNNGVIVVCATGNDYYNELAYPASHNLTISVGASDQTHQRTSESNYGVGIDLVAPGEAISGLSLNNWFANSHGTSTSTAIVSGAIGLMLSVNPFLTPSEVRSILHNTCTKPSNYSYNSDGWNQEVGYGIIDVAAAVEAAKLKIIGADIPCGEEIYYVEGVPNSCSVVWTWDSSSADSVQILQNSPLINNCTLVNDNKSYINKVLVASVYKDGILMASVQKRIYSGADFTGTFSQDTATVDGVFYPGIPETPFCDGDTLYVYQFGTLTIHSDHFVGTAITQKAPYQTTMTNYNNGTITIAKYPLFPRTWLSATTPLAHIPPINNDVFATPSITGKHPNNCSTFRFYFNHVLAPASSTSNSELVVSNVGCEKIFEIAQRSNSQSGNLENWTLEVVNALTSKKVFVQTTYAPSVIVNCSQWEAGTYVAYARIGKNVLSKKFIVNK